MLTLFNQLDVVGCGHFVLVTPRFAGGGDVGRIKVEEGLGGIVAMQDFAPVVVFNLHLEQPGMKFGEHFDRAYPFAAHGGHASGGGVAAVTPGFEVGGEGLPGKGVEAPGAFDGIVGFAG